MIVYCIWKVWTDVQTQMIVFCICYSFNGGTVTGFTSTCYTCSMNVYCICYSLNRGTNTDDSVLYLLKFKVWTGVHTFDIYLVYMYMIVL